MGSNPIGATTAEQTQNRPISSRNGRFCVCSPGSYGAVEPPTDMWQPQLAVIPRAGPTGHDAHTDPLVHHLVDHRFALVGVGAGVAFPHADPDAVQRLGLLDDLGNALERHAAQLS